ncbi:MAG TPA: serine/threonine-protein kinase [Labilithrix sp.]|nr:serine/threonine-protein kinase [Labilithrix sp.]
MLEEGAVLARKYRLRKRAGFGGMAQLWAATNEATGAEVCVKILVPDQSDDESVERFRREAYAAARLSHRAIVRIFDLVELGPNGETTTSGKPTALAIVMELLHGETLGDMLMKRGKLPVEEAIDLALPFLSALAHAHRAGVVHRDLKPDNIFLASDPDGHVIPKVLDFGVSKMAAGAEPAGPSARASSSQPLTLDGMMLGTPSFMSPEQARGSREVDARSDVFSAGILVYMMIAGRNPFESEHFHSVVSAIIHLDPPRPSGVPDAIWDVIARCLAKDAGARFADATELGIALRRASGRTSTTDSGPQSGIPSTPKVMVPPLGGDSIVTVPPVSGADAAEEEVAAAAAVTPARRRRIVMAVVAAAGLLAVVALLRTPERSGGTAVAASVAIPAPSPSASAPGPSASAPAPSASAPGPSASASATESAPGASAAESAAPDAGAVRKSSRPAPKKRDPHAEPSIVRDPGF